jgi:hypothetical protein
MSKERRSGIETCLVKCQVEPGMFKKEWLVFLDAVNPEDRAKVKVQLFVDEREVEGIEGSPRRNQPASGWLRVSLVKAKNELAQVVLPQPATPVGETVLVKRELINMDGR